MVFGRRTSADSDSDENFFVPKSVRDDHQPNTLASMAASIESSRSSDEKVMWDDINLLDRTLDSDMFESKDCSKVKIVRSEKFEHPFTYRPDRNFGTSNGISRVRLKLTGNRKESIVDELLDSIYESFDNRRNSVDSDTFTEYSTTSENLRRNYADLYTRKNLRNKDIDDLSCILTFLKQNMLQTGQALMRQLKRRDKLLKKRDMHYDVITATLQAASQKRPVDTRIKFTIEPQSGDSGFEQWLDAMKRVARLSEGVPPDFRKRLWLTLADRHIQHCKIDWFLTRSFCFNERSNPDDDNLGVQIVKDLHRTGCSLFCGEDAEHNQALLKRVLLAYARWNKTVGYCQGFNMLAALILEVMEKQEDDALKVMILLIERVLPESYFADNLRGLSVDMAVFRDLLKLKLPTLSRHLERLQLEARDGTAGTSYEPPLTNVFTMQWFLTLFSNCLPKSTVLRVWDLIFLEGSEVLLRTGLAIWDGLADRIMTVESADEFYSIMGVLTREMLAFGLMDANKLLKTVVEMAEFPFPQLSELRDKYTYNITPFTSAVGAVRRGLRMFYSDEEYDEEDDDQQIAVATWCLTDAFPPLKSPEKARDAFGRSPSPSSANFNSIGPGAFSPGCLANLPSPSKHNIDMERMTLDISALKKQYIKLRERQKQARIILNAGAKQLPGKIERPPISVNHLLLGKKALSSKNKKSVNPVVSIKITSTKPRQRPLLRRQMSMDPKMFRKKASNSVASTIFWKDVKNKDRNQQRVPPFDCNTNISNEAKQFAQINARRRSLDCQKILVKTSNKKPDAISEDDDASSTSTELCDDPDNDLSDLSSDNDLRLRADNRNCELNVKDELGVPDILRESQNKSAPTTPSERRSSLFGDDKLNGYDCDQNNKKDENTCDKTNNKNKVNDVENSIDDKGIEELREAVKNLKLTPRKTPIRGKSEISEKKNYDEVLEVEIEENSTNNNISFNPIDQPDSSFKFSSTDSWSHSIFPRNRAYSTQSSPSSEVSSKVMPQRPRTMSNPTSPIKSVKFSAMPTSYSQVCVSLKEEKRTSQEIWNFNNLQKSGNSPSSPFYSPSKQTFNPFPTLRTKDLNEVGAKFGIYSKVDQSFRNHNSFKFK